MKKPMNLSRQHSRAICYMVVQVVQRSDTGALLQWYDGDQRATMQEAKEDLKKMRKEYPDTEYIMIERVITEI